MFLQRSSVEVLEGRRLMHGGMTHGTARGSPPSADAAVTNAALVVSGTSAADTIALTQSDTGRTVVTVNGTVTATVSATRRILIDSGDGNDSVSVDAAVTNAVQVRAGAGNDTVVGGGGNDNLDGGAGNDLLAGAAGNDVVSGGTGNDLVFGTDGNDTVSGGLGNDSVAGGFGDDQVSGGGGNDVIYYRYLGTAGLDGNDTVTDAAAGDTLLFDDQSDGTIRGVGGDLSTAVAATDSLARVLAGGNGSAVRFTGGGTLNLSGVTNVTSISGLKSTGLRVLTI